MTAEAATIIAIVVVTPIAIVALFDWTTRR